MNSSKDLMSFRIPRIGNVGVIDGHRLRDILCNVQPLRQVALNHIQYPLFRPKKKNKVDWSKEGF